MPIVASRSLFRLSNYQRKWAIPAHIVAGRRIGGYKYISLQATPSTDATRINVGSKSVAASSPDATFEVLGQPYSLLSITLSPSQDLYTRRGTLIGVTASSDVNETISTLRLLGPVRRAPLGIPFLYQKITSTAPISALIATKSPTTSLAILQLDGTTDWRIAQRKAVLAWTGKTLQVTPTVNRSVTVAHWSNSNVTGRGLLALAGQGQIFTIDLAPGESYIAHPAHILAYTTSSSAYGSTTPRPTPYRFKSSTLRLTIPLALGNWFPQSNLVRNLQQSGTYKFFRNALLRVRTWSRRTIWGDRLFLKFEGPTTILVQSRGSQIREILSNREVDEIADAGAGRVEDRLYEMRKAEEDGRRTGVQGGMIGAATSRAEEAAGASKTGQGQPTLQVRDVSPDGKVTFEARQEKK